MALYLEKDWLARPPWLDDPNNIDPLDKHKGNKRLTTHADEITHNPHRIEQQTPLNE
jgi:hypothetical protein